MIDLVSLDALRAVETHGSVVAAADALGFTPSAVSQQIKRLERQTGVPLLERVGRGVMLTGHGRHLVEQGARLLADLEELQAGLHQQAATVAGHVRLAAFSTAMRSDTEAILIWAIPDFAAWADFEQGATADQALLDWKATINGFGAFVERTLMVDAPLAPLRTGRQPQIEDRRPLGEI